MGSWPSRSTRNQKPVFNHEILIHLANTIFRQDHVTAGRQWQLPDNLCKPKGDLTGNACFIPSEALLLRKQYFDFDDDRYCHLLQSLFSLVPFSLLLRQELWALDFLQVLWV